MLNFFNLCLLTILLLLSLWELVGIYRAYKKNLTTSLSRLLTHSVLLVLSVIVLIQIFFWQDSLISIFSQKLKWPLLITLGFIFLLGGWEFFGAASARLKGLTKNFSRSATHFFICLASLILFVRIF